MRRIKAILALCGLGSVLVATCALAACAGGPVPSAGPTPMQANLSSLRVLPTTPPSAPTALPSAVFGSTSTPLPGPVNVTRSAVYTNTEGGFTIQLPAGWVVQGPQNVGLGNLYHVGPPVARANGLASSTIIVADAYKMSVQDAVRQACGGSCAQVKLEDTVINGVRAQKTILRGVNSPVMEWYLVKHGNCLVYLSIHDPDTLQSREDIVQTLTFN